MQIIGLMCGISMKDRRTNEELGRKVGVEPITTVIRSGRMRCCLPRPGPSSSQLRFPLSR